MGLVVRIATGGVRVAGAVSPEAGAALALPLFARVGPVPRVRPADAATMQKARRSSLRIAGLLGTTPEVRVYEWGRGADVVVLAHGWGGRASQFATLVRELVAEGYRVVAFDAPAHGETPGRGTYLIDWTDALAELQRRYGLFHGIVGHSFGALGVLIATADGLAARRIVTVAAPSEPDALLSQFQSGIGYGDRTAAALRRRFVRRYFPDEVDPLARMSALRRPLPDAVELLIVHDRTDRTLPVTEAQRLASANPAARMLLTDGFGHNRVLAADPFLDATLELLSRPRIAASAASPERVRVESPSS